ncbi:unnamed protein product [Rhizoctonia solani]|uniref:BTB domain-containing protein n=1 Tax=Rhizoctonia solani TaxID=456999 RepID=A0A8H2WEA1_9AGAM|nr:unnamed protein product [Rhizoctonia solani]
MQCSESPTDHSGACLADESTNPTNNLNILRHTSHATTYVRDLRYYCLDDIGVFLVDGILFKVHAMQVFGGRPASIPKLGRGINPIYIEDVMPRLPTSSDNNPILLSGVTAEQFRNYLRVTGCRPGDEDYSTLGKHPYIFFQGEKIQELYTLYVDVATLARLFGTTKLEAWAIDVLHSMFTGYGNIIDELASLAQNWSASTLAELSVLSRNTKLERPAVAFIQHFVHIHMKDVTGSLCPGAQVCMDLFDMLKNLDNEDTQSTQSTQDGQLPNNPGSIVRRVGYLFGYWTGINSRRVPTPPLLSGPNDPVLLGCIFLKLLSLGHRSRIWSERVTRKDKAILYAAQVQFVDASKEFKSLRWVRPDLPREAINVSKLCPKCESNVKNDWKKFFGELSEGMGSGLPLKDVSLLTQIAGFRWKSQREWESRIGSCDSSWKMGFYCSSEGLLNFLDERLRELYEEVAYRYWKLAEYENVNTNVLQIN